MFPTLSRNLLAQKIEVSRERHTTILRVLVNFKIYKLATLIIYASCLTYDATIVTVDGGLFNAKGVPGGRPDRMQGGFASRITIHRSICETLTSFFATLIEGSYAVGLILMYATGRGGDFNYSR